MNFAGALVAVLLCLGGEGQAFANVKAGDILDNATLPTVAGDTRPFIGKEKATVFVFFSVEQPNSLRTLKMIAELQKELADRSIYWVAITSDSYPLAEVKKAVADAGLQGPVLLDKGDGLYGKLGGALTPIVGVTDSTRKLIVYLPFQKVNYDAVVKAWTRRTLGELSEAELQAVLSPAEEKQGGDAQVARRHLKYGERLLKAEDFEGAARAAQKSLTADPNLAAAHALLGTALAGQGKCADALPAFEKALALDAKDPAAQAGKERCAAK